MARFQVFGLLPVALISLLSGCAGESAAPETSTLSTEQACVRDNCKNGRCDFGGKLGEICGVKRFRAGSYFNYGGKVDMPRQRYGLEFDTNLVSVRLTVGKGKYKELPKLEGATYCGTKVGWFIDHKNAGKIQLCNCDKEISFGGAAWVDVLVGCKVGGGGSWNGGGDVDGPKGGDDGSQGDGDDDGSQNGGGDDDGSQNGGGDDGASGGGDDDGDDDGAGTPGGDDGGSDDGDGDDDGGSQNDGGDDGSQNGGGDDGSQSGGGWDDGSQSGGQWSGSGKTTKCRNLFEVLFGMCKP